MSLGQLLEGKTVAEYHIGLIKKRISQWQNIHGAAPQLTLATVQFGESADISLYSKVLAETLHQFGVRHIEKKYTLANRGSAMTDLMTVYDDPSVTGVLVYSPMQPVVDPATVFYNLPLEKDIEGRTFMKRDPFGVFSPTAKAIMALLEHLERTNKDSFSLKEKHAVTIGHSDLVGKPTAMLLADAGATVTVCHQHTRDIQERIAEAEILVAAIGKPRYVHGSWIKKGAVVIDVGENVVGGRVVGDVDFESALENAAYLSPVPGGVGPLTNLMIIENLLILNEYKSLYGNR